MKRAFVALVAGAVLLGATSPVATAQEVGPQKEAPLEQKVTLEDWVELGAVLAELDASLAEAETIIHATQLEWRFEECRFQSLESGTWTQREERLTAKCATDRWSVPGGLAKFMSEGFCESGYWRLAYNPNGHAGIYQHDIDYYIPRVDAAQPPSWDMPLSTEWRNSRGHIVMTAVYVHRNGWGAWDRWNHC